MTWTWRKFEETLDGFGPIKREIATNDKGVSIDPWGTYGAAKQICFKYIDGDIEIDFKAHRSQRNTEYLDESSDGVNYPLGPICEVFIDDRTMKFDRRRPLSAEERAKIEKNITEFLGTAFRECWMGAPPYAEQVDFY